jgi:hypothetical protein
MLKGDLNWIISLGEDSVGRFKNHKCKVVFKCFA